jgi:hypothetical protein
MKAGRPARFDYEYERNGTANLFMMFAPLEGWRHVKVTDRHTAVDYAHVLKELVDIHFANAKTIVFRGARKCARSATRRSTLRSRDRPCRRRGQGRSGACIVSGTSHRLEENRRDLAGLQILDRDRAVEAFALEEFR